MNDISVHDFKKIDFLDVRTPGEYQKRHIAGVRNLPIEEIFQHIEEFKNKEKIYVHCFSGDRSKLVVDILQSKGIKVELFNVQGGVLAWYQAGYPFA